MALDMFCVLRLLLEHSSLYLVVYRHVDREREEIGEDWGWECSRGATARFRSGELCFIWSRAVTVRRIICETVDKKLISK